MSKIFRPGHLGEENKQQEGGDKETVCQQGSSISSLSVTNNMDVIFIIVIISVL